MIEIKEEQQKQWVILKELQARMQGPVCDDDDETLEVDLPLRSMEQLDETERYLEDAVAQRKLVGILTIYLLFLVCIFLVGVQRAE